MRDNVVVASRQRLPRAGRLRPVLATAEVVAFSALAHAAAGGSLPGPEQLAALTALLVPASLALRHRLLTLRATASLAVWAQVAVHMLFSTTGAHGTHGAPAPLAGLSDDMFLAHGLSAVVTVLALVWQEQILGVVADWLVAARSSRLVLRWQDNVPAAGRASRGTWERMVDAAPRRGPPVVTAT